MLAARSTVFKAMLENENFNEANKRKAEVEDMDPKTLETLLKYIYTDEVSNEDISPALLSAADKYNMRTLVNMCEQR